MLESRSYRDEASQGSEGEYSISFPYHPEILRSLRSLQNDTITIVPNIYQMCLEGERA